jgi:hypothetical protein
MTTESREEASGFQDAEKENHHWYDCPLCDEEHLVDDDADTFKCPNVPDGEANYVLFI